MYEELRPPDAPRGTVRCRWRSVEHGPKRIVPDGCVDLVVGGGEAFVAGPDTAAWTSSFTPGTQLRGLRLRPGAAAAVLGVAADELRDQRVPLARLWNASRAEEILDGRELSDAVCVAATATDDPAVDELLARLARAPSRVGAPPPGLGERQLRRRFTLAVGYGPATYLRVLRLQRAIALAPSVADLATLAVAAGYADQPHFSRECRALTGLPPRAYFSLFGGNSRCTARKCARPGWPGKARQRAEDSL
ncbi:helix-turn-helix protein [Amycolatopsis sulphurea]|uniref:Helix-turn-helix protein n=1 Tax=Amycolatopsis sulphurea TaxID=76022 RepID=A0A2A9FH37_9PSEU|nr:helix-turn-helix domain-containing protein [Amycolatopsis sulphurea]PFG50777.1 helix-turn-helix protein [Amycolatopsis sulphurea]